MKLKSVLAVSLMVFSMVSLAKAWNYPSNQGAATGTGPNVPYPTAQPYSAPAHRYGGPYQPPSAYQGQPVSPDYSLGGQGDPSYPYPAYHNPYYDGAAYPRNYLSGAIEWFFSLPAYAVDSFSNFLDNNFFPRAPATSGGSPQPQPQSPYPSQGSPAPSAPLPPASAAYGPPTR